MSTSSHEYTPMIEQLATTDVLMSPVHRRLAEGLIGSAMAVTALTGCTSGHESEAPTATASASETHRPGQLDTFHSPHGECDPTIGDITGTDSPKYLDAARKCLALYAGTKVALVNFGLPSDEAQKTATQITQRTASVTAGNIKVAVTVVQPSKSAEQLFEHQNPKGCVDESDIERYGSYDASAVMPELRSYDKIVGISNLPSCDGKAEGIENGLFNRYADVFNVEKDWQKIEANGGKNEIVTKLGGGAIQMRPLQNPGDVATHELLHEFKLGHAGTLDSGGGDLQQFVLEGENTEASIDLDAYVANGTYTEYGDGGNIMGDVSGLRKDAPLTTVQQYLLAWPEFALHETAPVTVQDASARQVVFTDMSPRNSLAVLSLPTPLTMPTGGYSDASSFGKEQKFDTIAFVPQFDDNSGGKVWATDVYLASQDRSTATLGTLFCYNNSGNCRYDIKIGGRNVTLSMSDSRITIQNHP